MAKDNESRAQGAVTDQIISLLEAGGKSWDEMADNEPDEVVRDRMRARANENRGNVERIRAIIAAPAQVAQPTDIETAMRLAFESTNDSDNLAMYKHWFRKGYQAGAQAGDVRDAARYRWLRFADLDALAQENWGDGGEVYTGDQFDAAIDAAMSREQPTEQPKGGE